MPKEKMYKNSTSDKYVMERFNREFKQVEMDMRQHEDEHDHDHHDK